MYDRFRFRFRAYNTVTKEFVNNVSGISDYSDMENDDGKNFSFRAVNDNHRTLYTVQLKSDWILMQCTGLKDKNGKLIYEGDILKAYFENSDTGQTCFEYIPVGWDDEKCGFYIGLKYRALIAEGDFISEEYEVIGNIYENPELLEANDE